MINFKQTFPDVPGNSYKSKHKSHLCNLIYQQTTKKSFTHELILEKCLYLNTDKYLISKQDLDLFLRIVRQILLNSQDEQSKLVDVYTQIEKRNNEENDKLRNEITKLRDIVEKQKEKVNEICAASGVDNSESTSDNTLSTSEADKITSLDKRTVIKKLSL